MFEGMDEIEGADPYQLIDIQTGMSGVPPAAAPPEPTWKERIVSGVQAIGEAAQAKSQAEVAAQAQRLQQMQQAGQISQQGYAHQQALLQQHAQMLARQQSAGFWEKYKVAIILLGVIAVGGGAYWFWRKKRSRRR